MDISCIVSDIGSGNDNLDLNDLQMSFEVIKSGINQKIVYVLEVYSNFCRIMHCLRESPITSKLTCDFLLAVSVFEDVSYIISEILDVGMTT